GAGLKLALGRIDGDRHLDLLVAAHDTYAVHVLLGDGRGGFQSAPGSPVRAGEGTRPHTHDLVAGDGNGDRRPDAVTVNADDNNVSVLLGDGTGRFAPSRGSPFAAGRVPYEGVVLQDLDGDHDLDIVVINAGGQAATALLGDGRGGFATAPGSPIPLG